MVVALRRKSVVYAMKQTTFGTPATMAAASAVLVNEGNSFMTPKREILTRPVLRNSLSQFRHVVGREWVEGGLVAEVKGSGTQGTAPELDVLFQNAFGFKSVANTGSIVRRATFASGGANYATHIRIATLHANWTVGNMVRVGTAGTFAVAFIERTRATALFITPALPFTPTYANSISKSVNYRPHVTNGFLTIDQYLDNIRLRASDVKVASLSMNIVANQLVNAEFTLRGKTVASSNESVPSARTPEDSYDTGLPPAVLSARLNIGGSNVNVMNLEFTLELEVKERRSIRVGNASYLSVVARRITGSFDPHVENITEITNFVNGTAAQLIVEDGSTAGNIFAMRMPRIQYTDLSIGDEGGEFKYTIPFEARTPVAEPEQEVVLSFV